MDRKPEREVTVLNDDDEGSIDDIQLITPELEVIEIDDDDSIADLPETILPKKWYENTDKDTVLAINNEDNIIKDMPLPSIPKGQKRKNMDKGESVHNIDYDNAQDKIQNPIIQKTRKSKNRDKRKKLKRQVKVDTAAGSNVDTLFITQHVGVKRQKIQCIINLTNICDHKEKIKNKTKMSAHKDEKGSGNCKKYDGTFLKTSLEDRVVPHCLRKCCQSLIKAKNCKQKRIRKKKNIKGKSKNTSTNTSSSKNNTISLASDISSISLSEPEITSITYDNISSDSLSSLIYDTMDLDTLIKRTKDREKKMSITCDEQQLNAISTIQRF